jgi:hypothetical protein
MEREISVSQDLISANILYMMDRVSRLYMESQEGRSKFWEVIVRLF